MKTVKPIAFRFVRFERLESALFAATAVVMTFGAVDVFVRFTLGLA